MNRSQAVAIAAFTLAAFATPAQAHVTVAPPVARAGGFEELTFRCPDERANSATVKLVIELPQDHPIPLVKLRPLPGWHASITMQKLKAPVKFGHGTITEAVSTITWEGGEIAPDEYQDFAILAGPLPTGTKQLIFKAVQTYANGEVVRWIELRHPNQPEPAHPAPVLTLRAGT